MKIKEYLIKKGIEITDGKIRIEDLNRVHKLITEFSEYSVNQNRSNLYKAFEGMKYYSRSGKFVIDDKDGYLGITTFFDERKGKPLIYTYVRPSGIVNPSVANSHGFQFKEGEFQKISYVFQEAEVLDKDTIRKIANSIGEAAKDIIESANPIKKPKRKKINISDYFVVSCYYGDSMEDYAVKAKTKKEAKSIIEEIIGDWDIDDVVSLKDYLVERNEDEGDIESEYEEIYGITDKKPYARIWFGRYLTYN